MCCEVIIKNHKALTTSDQVAKSFGKTNKTVMRSIKNVIDKGINKSASKPIFYKGYKINHQNHQTYQFYYITESGFELISSHYISDPSKARMMFRFKKSFETAKSKLNKGEHKMKVYTDTSKVSKDTGYSNKRLDTIIRAQIHDEPGTQSLYRFKGSCVWEMTKSGFIVLISHLKKPSINQYKMEQLFVKGNTVKPTVLYKNLRAVRYALNTNTREFVKNVGMNITSYHLNECGVVRNKINRFTDDQKKAITSFVLDKLFEEDKEVLKSRKRQLSMKKAAENAVKNQTEKKYTKQDVIDMVNKILAEKGVTND